MASSFKPSVIGFSMKNAPDGSRLMHADLKNEGKGYATSNSVIRSMTRGVISIKGRTTKKKGEGKIIRSSGDSLSSASGSTDFTYEVSGSFGEEDFSSQSDEESESEEIEDEDNDEYNDQITSKDEIENGDEDEDEDDDEEDEEDDDNAQDDGAPRIVFAAPVLNASISANPNIPAFMRVSSLGKPPMTKLTSISANAGPKATLASLPTFGRPMTFDSHSIFKPPSPIQTASASTSDSSNKQPETASPQASLKSISGSTQLASTAAGESMFDLPQETSRKDSPVNSDAGSKMGQPNEGASESDDTPTPSDPFAIFSKMRSVRSRATPYSTVSSEPSNNLPTKSSSSKGHKTAFTFGLDGSMVSKNKAPTPGNSPSMGKAKRSLSQHVFLTAEEIQNRNLSAASKALFEKATVRVAADATHSLTMPELARLADLRIKHVGYSVIKVDSAKRGHKYPSIGATKIEMTSPTWTNPKSVKLSPCIKSYASSTSVCISKEKTYQEVNKRIESARARAMSLLTQLATELVKDNCTSVVLGKANVFLTRKLCQQIADILGRVQSRSSRFKLKSRSPISRIYDSVSTELKENYRNDGVWGRRYRMQMGDSIRSIIGTKERRTIELIKHVCTEPFILAVLLPLYTLTSSKADKASIAAQVQGLVSSDVLTKAALQCIPLMLNCNKLLNNRKYFFTSVDLPKFIEPLCKDVSILTAPVDPIKGGYLKEAPLYISKFKGESHSFYLTANLVLDWSTVSTDPVVPTTSLRPGVSSTSFIPSIAPDARSLTLSRLKNTVKPRHVIGKGENWQPVVEPESKQVSPIKDENSDSSSDYDSDEESRSSSSSKSEGNSATSPENSSKKLPEVNPLIRKVTTISNSNKDVQIKEKHLRSVQIPSSASLFDLVAISYGPQEGHITRINAGKTFPWLCFVLHFAPPGQESFKLYLSACNEADVDMWLIGLQNLSPICTDTFNHAHLLWTRFKLKFQYYGKDFVNRVCYPGTLNQRDVSEGTKISPLPEYLPCKSQSHEFYVSLLSAAHSYKPKSSVAQRISRLFSKNDENKVRETNTPSTPRQSQDSFASAVAVAGRRGSMVSLAEVALLAYDAKGKLSSPSQNDLGSKADSNSGLSSPIQMSLSRVESDRASVTSLVEEENPRAINGEYEPSLEELGIIDSLPISKSIIVKNDALLNAP